MKINQVAAQLYTLREHLKTVPDIARSLKRVREIGYLAVQASGVGPIPEAEFLALLKGEGLTLCATHEGNILTEPQKVIARLNALGCRYTAYPYPGDVKLETLAEVREFARQLNTAGKQLYEAGKILTYHNHHIEFRKIDGHLILDVLFNETDPRYLQGEIDTHWVQYGGGDPVAWCAKLKGRLPLLHMKDFAITPDNKIAFAEIGQGNLDWPRIVAAAEGSGCEWFIVEQDVCPGDPFDSLKQSFEYIRTTLCR